MELVQLERQQGVPFVDCTKDTLFSFKATGVFPGTVTPLLSLQASQELGFVKISDDVHAVGRNPWRHPLRISTITMHQEDTPTLQDPLLEKYTDVFNGLGTLPGEHSITLADYSVPKITLPRNSGLTSQK